VRTAILRARVIGVPRDSIPPDEAPSGGCKYLNSLPDSWDCATANELVGLFLGLNHRGSYVESGGPPRRCDAVSPACCVLFSSCLLGQLFDNIFDNDFDNNSDNNLGDTVWKQWKQWNCKALIPG